MRVIVFDADGTLYKITNAHEAYIKALGKDLSEEREEYKRTVKELGDPIYMSQRVFFALVSSGSPAERVREAYKRREVFYDSVMSLIEPTEIVEFLPRLYNSHIIFVASNDTKDFLLDKLARVGALPYIHHVFSAIDFGVLKPHEAYFMRLRAEIEERVGKTKIVFVDDLEENLEAAKRLGFEAYKPEEFVELLRQGYLLTERVFSSSMEFAFPELEADEINAAIRALVARECCSGRIVKEFEESFAKYLGVKHVLGVSNGTDAIFLAMRAIGIRGKKVAVPSMTFFATVEAVINAGGIPVFIDIKDDYTIDPEKLSEADFDVVMPVHLFGIVADMDEISKIAEEKGAVVIEDAAQAQGSERRGKKVGSLGIAGAFSFYPTKNLFTCGRAGAVSTNDDEIAKKVSLLRAHGETKKYFHELVGRNMRMSDVEAAILKEQIKKLDERVEIRRRNAKILYEGLEGLDVELPPQEPQHAKRSRHLFPVYVKEPDKVVEGLNRLGVPARRIYSVPIHKMPVVEKLNDPSINPRAGFVEYPDYKGIKLENTERLASGTIVLPVHHGISEEEAKSIVEAFKRVLS